MEEYGVHAPDRETLKNFIRLFVSDFIPLGQEGAALLEIVMPCCGEIRRYRQELDLPVNDVQCSCGNWFIKYDEQPFRVMF